MKHDNTLIQELPNGDWVVCKTYFSDELDEFVTDDISPFFPTKFAAEEWLRNQGDVK